VTVDAPIRGRLGTNWGTTARVSAFPDVEPNFAEFDLDTLSRALPSTESLLADLARRESGAPQRDAKALSRRARYDGNRRYSTLKAVRGCGRVGVKGYVSVRLADTGKVYAHGLMSCQSAWACSYCASRIQAQRASEIEAALFAAAELGWGATFITTTQRHHFGQRLGDQLNAQQGAWKAFTQRLRRDPNFIGYVSVIDITVGLKGWHPHKHSIAFTRSPGGLSDATARAAFISWSKALERAGLAAADADAGGLDCQLLDLSKPGIASYLAKSPFRPAALEATSNLGKQGRNSGRNFWQLGDDIAADPNPGDLALLTEYEKATKGRRAVAWTRGLRDTLGITGEAEIASADTELVRISRATWKALDATPGAVCELLGAAAQTDYRQAITEAIRRYGLPPPDFPPDL